MNLDDLISRGIGIVLRNLEISYVNEARLGDTLTVKTIPYRRGRSSYTIKQVIYKQDDEVITESKAVSVMIDLEKRKSIPLIEEFAKHFQSTKDHRMNRN